MRSLVVRPFRFGAFTTAGAFAGVRLGIVSGPPLGVPFLSKLLRLKALVGHYAEVLCEAKPSNA
jgi:hypothetical protein